MGKQGQVLGLAVVREKEPHSHSYFLERRGAVGLPRLRLFILRREKKKEKKKKSERRTGKRKSTKEVCSRDE